MPQVRRAARNAWAVTLGGGLERPHATPSEVLHDGPHELLRRFTGAEDGRPVLFVPPLAAPASCFDLRRGQSLAEFLLAQGRSPYVVDYGEITFADRTMGLEDWVDEIIPNALTRTSAAAGGRPVDVVSWSLGGTLSLLTAAAHGDLPIRSITAVGTPVDYGKLRNLAPVRAVERYTGGRIGSTANRITGGVPSVLVKTGFRLTALDRTLTKPLYIARNLLDDEALGRMGSVDRFMADMPGYPGRLYGQLYRRLMVRNELARGSLRVGGRRVELADVKVPVLVVAGSTDVITPAPAALAAVDLLTSAPEVRAETTPGSHLGILTGPEARDTTWAYLAEFLADLDAAS
jgi:polyhydroxyalkanoate synthase